MAEAAAANGIEKKVIPAHVAEYTAQSVQNAVSPTLVMDVMPETLMLMDCYSIISTRSFSRNLT
jgi:hypothetical protein